MDRIFETIQSPHADGKMTVGVVSDTHVPDRAVALHPQLLERLRGANVDLILHAGDISIPDILQQLGEIAPVLAVRGNRDLFFGGDLPLVRCLDLAGVRVALTHGHGGWIKYVSHKLSYMRHGYRLDRILPVVRSAWLEAQVVIFGHTHYVENRIEAGQLIFNPGSASLKHHSARQPSFGLLHIYLGLPVRAEVIDLEGVFLAGRRWIKK